MAAQANITLTALEGENLLLDIPVRTMTLTHPNDFVVLGRASTKEPKPKIDGREDKKTVSRIAAVNNGYMSRNETVGSEHAKLVLMHDGEVCLEHKMGRFPPTFVNGNQVKGSVQVENNDIINLGPLNPYTSKHKARTYQPFALKLNIAYKYKVLTGDEHSSSSEEEEEEEIEAHSATLNMYRGDLPQKSTSNTIHQHEIINVSSSDDDDSSTHDDEDDIYGATPRPQSPQQSEKKTETVIIDLTESEGRSDMQAVSQQSKLPCVSYAQYDSTSDEDEIDKEIEQGEEFLNMSAEIDEEMDSDELDESMFGDNASNAPSEEPIERSSLTCRPFSKGFRLDYSPGPELFHSDMNIGLDSDFDSEDTDLEENDDDDILPSPVVTEKHIPKAHPYLAEHLRRFQEDERARLEKKEREEEKDRREELAAFYRRAEERERDEGNAVGLREKADRWNKGMEKEKRDMEHNEEIRSFGENMRALNSHLPFHGEWQQQAGAMMWASEKETSKSLSSQVSSNQHKMNVQPPQFPHIAQPMVPGRDTATEAYRFLQGQPATPPLQVTPQAAQAITRPSFVLIDYDMNAHNNLNMGEFGHGQELLAPSANLNNPNMLAPCLKTIAHSASDFQAARAENRATLINMSTSATQQPTPPSLLMSGSLFGQDLQAGMLLPALPPYPPKDETPNFVTEETKKWWDGETCAWMGDHRITGKVRISDLLEREEQVLNDEDEGMKEMSIISRANDTEAKESANESAKEWMLVQPPAVKSICTASVQAVPIMTVVTQTEDTAKKQKTNGPKTQELSSFESRLSTLPAKQLSNSTQYLPAQTPVYCTQANLDRMLGAEHENILKTIAQATAEGEAEKATAAVTTPTTTENKKRKHVEFEDHDTVIAPVPATIFAACEDSSGDDTVSLSLTKDHGMDFTMASSSTTTLWPSATVKHVHFNQPIATPIASRPIAMPVRPSKKLKAMKKVAEGLGLVALGAAGVFAALVASAPEF